jgi:hypothetical protein
MEQGNSFLNMRHSALDEREAFANFRRAAGKLTKRSTRSAAAAREALASTGIYTPSGKLAKPYRSQ